MQPMSEFALTDSTAGKLRFLMSTLVASAGAASACAGWATAWIAANRHGATEATAMLAGCAHIAVLPKRDDIGIGGHPIQEYSRAVSHARIVFVRLAR